MTFEKLEKNLMDVVLEEQAKIRTSAERKSACIIRYLH